MYKKPNTLLLLVSLVSALFLVSYSCTGIYIDPPDLNTTSNLPESLVFNFNDNYQEEVFTLHFNSLDLGAFNKLTLFFQVNGSSNATGLTVSFLINTTEVNFLIEQFYQDGTICNLTETFFYSSTFSGDLDIFVTCAGQSSGSEGTLTILNFTQIEPMIVPDITEESSSLPLSQDCLVFEGNMLSWVSRSLSSAFYFHNDTSCNITLSFNSGDFKAFERTVTVDLNGKTIAEESFSPNSSHTFTTYCSPVLGLNVLSLNFSIRICTELIIVSDIVLEGSPYSFSPEDGCLDAFQWESGPFNYSFDLSKLKPIRYHANQVIHITLVYSCTGAKISPAISYQFLSGSKIIGEGEISYFEQMMEHGTLTLYSYTSEYHQDLLFTIQGSATGLGQFMLYNSSTMATVPIDTLEKEQIVRLLENELVIDSKSSVASLFYYDVFTTTSSTDYLALALNFDLSASYEYPFDQMYVTLYIDNTLVLSDSVNSNGFVNISETLPIQEGYHEVVIGFQISGINNPFVIQHLQYQIVATDQPISNNSVLTPPASVPRSISWLLGLYAILFFYFVDKRIYRKGVSKTHSTFSGFVQETKQKEWLRLTFTLLSFLSTYIGLIFLSRLFDVFHWFFLALSAVISLTICFFVYVAEIKVKFFQDFGTRVKGFFSDVDSLRKLVSKTVTTFKQKTTIKVLRGVIIALILLLLIINVGVLFFVNGQLQLLPSTSSLFIFSDVWQAYFLLYGSMGVSTLFLLYVVQFIFRMAFIEDNLKRLRVLGKVAVILVTGSLICVVVLLFSHQVNLSIVWTSLSPLFMVGISKTSTRLGKTLEKTYVQASNGFMGQGRFFTNSKEVQRAVEEGIETRAEWEKEKQEINKNKVRGVIIWDIKAEVPVVLARLAELANVEKKETEGLLEEIVAGTPSLGEYHKKEQVFIKKSTDNTSGTTKMTEEEPEEKSEEKEIGKEVIEWEGTIHKGGGSGSGQITVPMKLRVKLEVDQFYDLTLVVSDSESYVLTAKFKQRGKGSVFYVPKVLCDQYSLIGKAVTCYIYKMEHFPIIINEDKIVGLPHSIVDEYKLKKDDMWEVEILTEKGIFREVILIGIIDRSNRSDKNEHRFTLRLSDVPRSTEARAKFVRKIVKLPSKQKNEVNYENYYLPKLFPDGIMGKVHENEMIIFQGNHVPIFIPIRINLLDFIHYFGCYYADGTKKGWAWRISASTPEQANYYITKYNSLVFGNCLKFRLIYTKKPSDKRREHKIKNALIDYWKNETGIEIEKERIRVRTAKTDSIRKWNVCGSLSIRDDRSLLMEIHTRILGEVTKYLNSNNIKNDMWAFLFGILEGDGSVCGGKNGFGISFAFHKNDNIIRELLNKLQIQYSVDSSRIKNKTGSSMSASFWLFEVLQNLDLLGSCLFIYYPKRRKMFIERLLSQQTVRFIMGKHDNLTPVSEKFFNESKIDFNSLEQILLNLETELRQMNVETKI